MTNEEIIKSHQVLHDNIDCVVFEPQKVTNVVLSFTGMQLGNYNKWSWYYDEYINGGETLYIVFKDDEHLFYLNRLTKSDFVDVYIEFIKSYIDRHGLTSKHVKTVGSSMGAYAAIYYGILLNVDSIVASVPIVDYASALLITPYNTWTRKMETLKEHWVDLNKFIDSSPKSDSFIYVIHGQFKADLSATDTLISSLKRNRYKHERITFEGVTHFEYLTRQSLFNLLRKSETK